MCLAHKQIQRIMNEFEKESATMDMKEEMMSDAVDDAMEDEDEGEGEEAEGDKILKEVLDEIGMSMNDAVGLGTRDREGQADLLAGICPDGQSQRCRGCTAIPSGCRRRSGVVACGCATWWSRSCRRCWWWCTHVFGRGRLAETTGRVASGLRGLEWIKGANVLAARGGCRNTWWRLPSLRI